MTPKEIVRRIGLPIVKLGVRDGHGCPVCDKRYAEAKLVGVHMQSHWTEAGVVHRPHGTDRVVCPDGHGTFTRHGYAEHLTNAHKIARPVATGMARVAGFDLDRYFARQQNPDPVSPVAEPGRPGRRRVRGSWTGKKVADMTPEEHADAKEYWREERRRKDARDRKKKEIAEPVVRHLPATVTKVKEVKPIIDPTDAALAVIESQVNGHGVPAHLLHDVVMYVDHTREIAGKLRGAS